jgi:hypothetical protein
MFQIRVSTKSNHLISLVEVLFINRNTYEAYVDSAGRKIHIVQIHLCQSPSKMMMKMEINEPFDVPLQSHSGYY